MPLYIEYDKITREIRRVLSADDLPTDAAHLSYIEIPVGTPEIDLTADIDTVGRTIDTHVAGLKIAVPRVKSDPEKKPPLIEEV